MRRIESWRMMRDKYNEDNKNAMRWTMMYEAREVRTVAEDTTSTRATRRRGQQQNAARETRPLYELLTPRPLPLLRV